MFEESFAKFLELPQEKKVFVFAGLYGSLQYHFDYANNNEISREKLLEFIEDSMKKHGA